MSVTVTGLDKLTVNITKKVFSEERLAKFNAGLSNLVTDWAKAGSTVYHRPVGAFKPLFRVESLKSVSGIKPTGSTSIAKVFVRINNKNSLSNFHYSNTVEETGHGLFKVNRTAIKRASAERVTVVPRGSRSKLLANAKTAVTPVARGRVKGFTIKGRTGIYIRLQASTWSKGRRLPIVKMYAPQDGYLLISKAVRESEFKLHHRLIKLGRLL